jgi:hypothetical protein
VIGMCGSGALSLSAAQVDRRIKAVAPVVMYAHHRLYSEGSENSLTEEQRIEFLDERAEQRYADFEADVPLLTRATRRSASTRTPTPSPASSASSTPRPAVTTPTPSPKWTTTSSLSFMNFPLLTNITWISAAAHPLRHGRARALAVPQRGRLRARGRAEGALRRPERGPRRPLRQDGPDPVRQARRVLHREPGVTVERRGRGPGRLQVLTPQRAAGRLRCPHQAPETAEQSHRTRIHHRLGRRPRTSGRADPARRRARDRRPRSHPRIGSRPCATS